MIFPIFLAKTFGFLADCVSNFLHIVCINVKSLFINKFKIFKLIKSSLFLNFLKKLITNIDKTEF